MINKTVDIKPMQRLDQSLTSIGGWLRSIDTQVVSLIHSEWQNVGAKDVSFPQHQSHSDIPEWTYQRNSTTRYPDQFLKEKKWYQHLGISLTLWHTNHDWRNSLTGLTANQTFSLGSQGSIAARKHVLDASIHPSLVKNTTLNAKSLPFPSLQFPEGLSQFWATSYQLSTALAVLLPIAVNAVQAPNVLNLLTQALPVNPKAINTSSVIPAVAQPATQAPTVKTSVPVRYSFTKPTGRIANIQSYALPAKGEFTSAYGMRWGRMHKGIDIAGPVGTPILAAAGGKVLTAGWGDDGFGNKVEIQHPDGTVTLYAHTSRVLTRVGAIVHQGQQIAEIGSTGSSTGPHLHFQIHPGGKDAVDPLFFFAGNQMLKSAQPD